MNQQNWAGAAYGVQPATSLAGAHPVIPHPAAQGSSESDELEETWPPRVAPITAVPIPAGYPTETRELAPDLPQAVVFTGTSADLAEISSSPRPEKAMRGWRRGVRTLTGGLIAPNAGREEVSERADRALVCSQWSRPVTVTIASPKGGAGKTTTTVGLAAVFGDLRGGGVLAWDNNETLGTLGIRTQPGRFPTTVVTLLDHIETLEQRRASRGDLGGFVRFQESGHFDVLASDEDPGQMATVGAHEFNRIHDVVARFHQALFIDTGNNPRSSNFVAALDRTDVLVIPLRWKADLVQSAGRLMDQLRKNGHNDLVDRAVVVVTNDGGQSADPKIVAGWRDWFTEATAGVYEIPYDQHLAEGDAITYSRLSDRTRRAYLHLAAGIAGGLNNQNGWN